MVPASVNTKDPPRARPFPTLTTETAGRSRRTPSIHRRRHSPCVVFARQSPPAALDVVVYDVGGPTFLRLVSAVVVGRPSSIGSAASVRVEGAAATARILSRGFRRSNAALASEADGREEKEDKDAASLIVVIVVVVVGEGAIVVPVVVSPVPVPVVVVVPSAAAPAAAPVVVVGGGEGAVVDPSAATPTAAPVVDIVVASATTYVADTTFPVVIGGVVALTSRSLILLSVAKVNQSPYTKCVTDLQYLRE
jgi:hypothetical protein